MTFKIEQFLVGQMANFTYLIVDVEKNELIVVDPSWDLEKIFEQIKKNHYRVKYIINTHTHFDHILGNEQLASVTDCKILQHENSKERYDIALKDRDRIELGNTVIEVIYTPGHSKDSICLIIDSKAIITGDTLFVGNCGRIDLPGGDPGELYESLFVKLSQLDRNLLVYPGHNYGHKPISSIGEEIITNYVLTPRTKEDFIKFMMGED